MQDMMVHQYASYVIQKAIETSNNWHRNVMVLVMRRNIHTLRRNVHGRRVIAHVQEVLASPVVIHSN